MAFTHLHVHSHFSLLDGLPQIKPLVKTAKQRGFSALALTDYSALYGMIKFVKTCQAEGIKPIVGAELFVAPNGIESRDPKIDQKVHHVVLLAKDFEGYKSLMKLISIAQVDGFYYRPRVDKTILREHAHNLIALSGCMAGIIPQVINSTDDREVWKREIQEYESIFGKGNLYLELQDHPEIDGQVRMNNLLAELGAELDVPIVATRDVHYLDPDDAQAQDIVSCIKTGRKINDSNRFSMVHVDRSLCTEQEIESRFEHLPQALENTQKIVDACNVEIPLGVWHFPPVDIEPGKTADEMLREQTYARIPNLMEVTDEVEERIDYELKIIKDKGYSTYFLSVADYVQWARERGIVETTRGSAAGSLVSYALNITTVDPLFFKLPFERFLNPQRPSAPDIDTDFADDRRDEVIEYVTNKYGKDHVAQIVTFGTMAARASVRDAGRALGMSYTFCDQVAKVIPQGAQGMPMTIEKALNEAPDLKKLYKSNEEVQKLLDIAQKIEGNARHCSVHAAGVVISPTPLTDYTPVQKESGGEKITTQYEMKSVEDAGLVKMDFLGIRNLSILGNSVALVEQVHGEKIDIFTLPLDDQKTFEMLARGETMGVFQLSGSGMTRYLKELQPSTIFDIMAMVALFRPGPMDSIPEYIERKHDRKPVTYPEPRLEDVMDKSFGVMVYQDDVMSTAMKLAGYSWLEADKLRKAMGKKIPEEMAKQKIKFFDGCKEFGKLDRDKIAEIWKLMEPFALYGFNKAHAASYAIVAYQTAYMKAHYPVCYMSSVLTAESGDSDKVAAIVAGCNRIGIEVLPPDINESFKKFTVVSTGKDGEPMRIRFGLAAIKNVGENICDVIIAKRKEGGKFASLEDFLERVQHKDLNKRSLDGLIRVGAMEQFGDRGKLLHNIENIISFSKELQQSSASNQDSLFASAGMDIGTKVPMQDSPAATEDERLAWEKELIGLYLSGHPYKKYADVLEGIASPSETVEQVEPGGWVTIGGIVSFLKKKITKKGKVMAFVNVQDLTGTTELLVFPGAYEGKEHIWQEDQMVVVVGRKGKEAGDNKVFVDKGYVLSDETIGEIQGVLGLGRGVRPAWAQTADQQQAIIAIPRGLPMSTRDALKQLFENNPGEHQVIFEMGGKKVVSNMHIDWNDNVQQQVQQILQDAQVAPA